MMKIIFIPWVPISQWISVSLKPLYNVGSQEKWMAGQTFLCHVDKRMSYYKMIVVIKQNAFYLQFRYP